MLEGHLNGTDSYITVRIHLSSLENLAVGWLRTPPLKVSLPQQELIDHLSLLLVLWVQLGEAVGLSVDIPTVY
jgi:hypothetical protein